MIYVHKEQVNNLTVSWSYRDDRKVETVCFTDTSVKPFKREINLPKDLRYSTTTTPKVFALSLYKSYYLQKSIENICG